MLTPVPPPLPLPCRPPSNVQPATAPATALGMLGHLTSCTINPRCALIRGFPVWTPDTFGGTPSATPWYHGGDVIGAQRRRHPTKTMAPAAHLRTSIPGRLQHDGPRVATGGKAISTASVHVHIGFCSPVRQITTRSHSACTRHSHPYNTPITRSVTVTVRRTKRCAKGGQAMAPKRRTNGTSPGARAEQTNHGRTVAMWTHHQSSTVCTPPVYGVPDSFHPAHVCSGTRGNGAACVPQHQCHRSPTPPDTQHTTHRTPKS